MAKFYGKIGYSVTVETSPGLWEEQITELDYYGDVIKDTKRYQQGENLNDNLILSQKFSVLSDPFADENFHAMRYIKWMGASWRISEVDVQRPRLIITTGGVYNGEQGPTTDHT